MTSNSQPALASHGKTPAAIRLPRREIVTVMTGAGVSLFVASLTNTVIGIALPTIAGELGGQDKVGIVASAALLTMCVSTPLWGKTSDLYGRKPLFMMALVVFSSASVLAGVASNMPTLIVGRSLQGVGAAGILSLANALVADFAPPRERARYTSYFGAAFGIASIAGPFAGGLLVEAPGLGWRWCFLGAVPIVIVAGVLIARAPIVSIRRRTRIDYLGAALLSAAVGGLILALSASGKAWPWLSWQTAMLVALTCLAIVAALYRESHTIEPILPVRLFRNRTFGMSCAASFLVGVVMFTGLIYLPQFLQVAKGLSALSAGLHMLPMMIGVVTATFISGHLIARFGRWRIYPIVGCVMILVAYFLLSFLDVDSSMIEISCYIGLLGLGIGSSNQILVLIAQNSVPARDLGVGTSTVSFLRTLGGAVGVAAFGLAIDLQIRARPMAVSGPSNSAGMSISSYLGTPEQIGQLPSIVQNTVRELFASGMHLGFLLGVPVAAAALLCTLFVSEQETPTEAAS